MTEINSSEWELISSAPEKRTSNNQSLTNEIVKHVFANLGVYDTRTVPIQHDGFLTDKMIVFTDDADVKHSIPVYGCEIDLDGSKLQLMCVSFDLDKEATLLVQLQGCPLQGCYLADKSIVGIWARDRWICAPMSMQASFLAGMEHLREIGSPFDKIKDTNELFARMKSFITFYDGLIDE